MKKVILLGVALLLFFNIQGYGQQQEPQFIMPLVFIDANNDSDTLWLGYDPEASNYLDVLDTNLGETVQWIDTTKFHVYWHRYLNGQAYPNATYPIDTDTVGKICIRGGTDFSAGYVGFVNGEMPITIKWVDSLLDSPNLPDYYPDTLAPRPRARIDIYNDGLPAGPCPLELPYVLSGYLKPFEENGYCGLGCCAKDSLYLDALPGWTPGVMYLYFIVSPHNGGFMNNAELNPEPGIKISPNPFRDSFIVSVDKSCLVSVYNAYGKPIYSTRLEKKEKLNISCLSKYSSGIYFIHFKTKSNLLTKKIIKL